MAELNLPAPGDLVWAGKLNNTIRALQSEMEFLHGAQQVAINNLSSLHGAQQAAINNLSSLLERIRNVTDPTFRLALQALLEPIIEAIGAGIISSDPTLVEAAAQAVEAYLASIDLDDRYLEKETLMRPHRAYAVPFTDEVGRVFGGVTAAGEVDFRKMLNAVHARDFINPSRTGTPLTDRNGRVFGWISQTGTVTFSKLEIDGGGGDDPAGSTVSAEGQTVSNRFLVAAAGDSHTDGFDGTNNNWPENETWPYALGLLDTGATVVNLGESGQTTDEIAIRLGALPLTLQSDVTVPTSGPVTVTVQSGIGWRPDRDWTFHGMLGTIPGTITRTGTATTTLTFEADNLTAAQVVPAGTRFVGDAMDPWALLILGCGRNDISYGVTGEEGSVIEHVKAATKRIVDWLAPQRKRFLVWGTINTVNELPSTSGYAAVTALNDWLRQTYPLQFVDVRRWLIDEAIYELGIEPTSADLSNMSQDAPPPSVMADTTHWIKAVAPKLADLFYLNLTRRDWQA